jgi:hypothetical protein
MKTKTVSWPQSSDEYQKPVVGAANHQVATVKCLRKERKADFSSFFKSASGAIGCVS